MVHPAFDTLKFVETLTSAGVPAVQAKAFAKAQNDVLHEMFDQTAATKADVKESQQQLKAEIQEVRQELKAEIQEVRQELKAEIQEVRQELKAEIQDVRLELKDIRLELKTDIHELDKKVTLEIAEVKSEQRVMKWMLGVVIAGMASVMTGVGSLVIKIFF